MWNKQYKFRWKYLLAGFHPIFTKISTFADHGLRSFNCENGADRTNKVQFQKWCGSNAGLHYPQKIFLYGVTSHQKKVAHMEFMSYATYTIITKWWGKNYDSDDYFSQYKAT